MLFPKRAIPKLNGNEHDWPLLEFTVYCPWFLFESKNGENTHTHTHTHTYIGLILQRIM